MTKALNRIKSRKVLHYEVDTPKRQNSRNSFFELKEKLTGDLIV